MSDRPDIPQRFPIIFLHPRQWEQLKSQMLKPANISKTSLKTHENRVSVSNSKLEIYVSIHWCFPLAYFSVDDSCVYGRLLGEDHD